MLRLSKRRVQYFNQNQVLVFTYSDTTTERKTVHVVTSINFTDDEMSNLGTKMRQGLNMRDKPFSKAKIVPDVTAQQTKLDNCCTVMLVCSMSLNN